MESLSDGNALKVEEHDTGRLFESPIRVRTLRLNTGERSIWSNESSSNRSVQSGPGVE